MSVTRASRTSVSSADLTQVGCATAVVAKKSVTDASPRIHFVMRVLLCGLFAAPRQSGAPVSCGNRHAKVWEQVSSLQYGSGLDRACNAYTRSCSSYLVRPLVARLWQGCARRRPPWGQGPTGRGEAMKGCAI